ncbi:MAG: hypothetical protein WAL38_03665 [Solirubrobacteraceae bacterium]
MEDVECRLPIFDRQLERLAGLGVLHGDRHALLVGVPQQPDVDAVAGAAVELACPGKALAWELVRVGWALISGVWIDHARNPLGG